MSGAQVFQRLLSSQPARRLNPAKLATNPVLHNKLVDITASLENLSVRASSAAVRPSRADLQLCACTARCCSARRLPPDLQGAEQWRWGFGGMLLNCRAQMLAMEASALPCNMLPCMCLVNAS